MKQSLSRLSPLISAICALGIFGIFYAIYGIYPFGEKSVAWCDMQQQGIPLLTQMREILRSGDNVCYTPLDAGGMNFLGIFYFFLCNPFSCIALYTDIPLNLLMNLLVPMNLALASAAASVWIGYRIPKSNAFTRVLTGVMYGVCGYGLFYFQNLMWLDVQALAPLLLLAVDMLLHRRRVLPYVAALSALVTLCFYLGFMAAIFLLIYVALAIRYSVSPDEKPAAARRFWCANIAAACITAAVWLPALLEVMASARGGGIIHSLQKGYITDGAEDKLALLLCTPLIFAVIPWVFKRRANISEAEQMRRMLLSLLLLTAAMFDPINRMWHTGSYQAFPFRWAFFPILLLLTLAAELFSEPRAESERKVGVGWHLLLVGICASAGISSYVLLRFSKKELLEFLRTLWVDLPMLWRVAIPAVICVIGYVLLLQLYRKRQLNHRICAAFMALLFACHLPFSMFYAFCGNAAEDPLYAQTMSAAHQIQDDTFYRVKQTKKYAHANMVGALGYPTLAHYTSLTREDFLVGVKKMGYSSYWMEVPSTGGTVLSDALWGVRYQLGQTRDFPAWTEQVWTDKRLSIAKSTYQLPIGIVTEDFPEADLPSGSRTAVQRYLAATMLGADDLIVEYPATATNYCTLANDPATGLVTCNVDKEAEEIKEIRFAMFVPDHQALYFDLYSLTGTEIGNPRNGAVSVSVNGKNLRYQYPENDSNGVIFLGEYAGDYVSVRIVVNKDFACESFGVFGIRLDAMADAFEAVHGAEVVYDGRGCYSAKCTNEKSGVLTLAIPFDEGFTATVNGESAEIVRTNSCEMSVAVPSGDCEIRLKFVPRGLRIGMIFSVVGAGLTLLALGLRRAKRLTLPVWTGRAALAASAVSFALVLLIVYISPLIIFITGCFT